ncbi:hypothetical protein Kpol_1028p88 [Vanderwaltozyma polyspora DSM 70294]|uniref:Kinetochore-associated protein n=1 Tax=Vanderwaltozyma polyspora (strain ATCC 22028 / DSM 70294 / BCRC 21397 / CBS 2163 / NBRC 10782 / NRRL Y-8283 / UCD 57-17) TaxID=436907 RepID=A7TG55_VANPO|nr:uncharacterized protein Kpol_1028p88 [Vanderwaltozyma polyspora DSM 70294]EDO18812.1 hypothetical protein Kpol_1028p88 [Vanderwaltozyma polyspora DSM 70294]
MSDDQKIRYVRFCQVFNKAISQTLLKLQNWDKIKSCFPEYSETREGAQNLVTCQEQVSQFWVELCKREFNEIVEERQVKIKLDDLDDLIIEAKKRLDNGQDETALSDNSIPIDQLTCGQLIECNLHGQRLKAIEELDEKLNHINEVNEQLGNQIKELEDEIELERQELRNVYKTHLGDHIQSPPDEVLLQGLNDMLLELQETC